MGAKAKMAGRLIKGAFGLGVDAAKPVAKVAGKAIGAGMDGVGLGVEVAGAGIRGASKAIGLGEKTTYSPAPAAAAGSLVIALDTTKNGGFL